LARPFGERVDATVGQAVTLDLEAIKARAEAATPGPWSCGSEQLDDTRIQSADGEMTIYDEGGHTWKDADFIAHAITDVPALVAEVERLRWMETELTQAVRLADQEADGIQAELQAEVERLRAENATARQMVKDLSNEIADENDVAFPLPRNTVAAYVARRVDL